MTQSLERAEFAAKHHGHESLHLTLLLMMLAVMVAAQVALMWWKQRSPRTYYQVTLLGLLLLPLAYAVVHGFVRFMVVWTLYAAVSAWFVSRPFVEKPLQPRTPRRVYWFFFLLNKSTFALAALGYALLLVDSLAGRVGLVPYGLLLLFYGLLFGVISRDLAEVCADKVGTLPLPPLLLLR